LKQKKILIITHGFYPENSPRSFRATELAKELYSQGNQVTVIAPYRDGINNFLQEYPIKLINIGKLKWHIFNFNSLGKLGYLYNKLVNRLLPLLFEYPAMELFFKIRNALKKEKEVYDLLISIAVPHPIHWAVASVWNCNNKNNVAKVWVADCGDPYMYSLHDSFRKPFYFHFFENKFLKKADHVSIPFDEMKDLFNKKYREKFITIPQGFKFINHNLAIYQPNRVITFSYSGTVMPGSRDPFELINYLEELNVNYCFIIYTAQKHLFNKYEKILNKKIILKDYIKRDQLIYELSKMDFLLNVNTPLNNGKINAIPSKLIDYYFIQRPVLSYEFGYLPKNVVDEFINSNFQNQHQFINMDRYKIENVVSQFIALCN